MALRWGATSATVASFRFLPNGLRMRACVPMMAASTSAGPPESPLTAGIVLKTNPAGDVATGYLVAVS